MDSLKFQDVRVEKANAVAKYRKIQRITSLFRFVEVLIFLIVVSRFSTQFASSLKLFVEQLRGISVVALIGPRSVFVVGNAIVIALFFISRQFSGERSADFYDEYVEKCRTNHHHAWNKVAAAEIAPPQARSEGKAISRTQSANLARTQTVRVEDRRRDLRRSMSDNKYQKKKAPVAVDEEMSSEEFRRTVEAFIARQQRSLREEDEEGVSAVVSIQA